MGLNLGGLSRRHEIHKALHDPDTHCAHLSLLLELIPLIVNQLQQYAVYCLWVDKGEFGIPEGPGPPIKG